MLLVALLSSSVLATGLGRGASSYGKKKSKVAAPAPQQVIILPAGPSVTYPWVGFGNFKGKAKKVPKISRPPFPSLLPAAPAPVVPVLTYSAAAPAPQYAPAAPQYAPAPAAPQYAPAAPQYEPAPAAPQYAPAPQWAPSAPQYAPEPIPYAAAAAPQQYVAAPAAPAAPAYESITSPVAQYSQPLPAEFEPAEPRPAEPAADDGNGWTASFAPLGEPAFGGQPDFIQEQPAVAADEPQFVEQPAEQQDEPEAVLPEFIRQQPAVVAEEPLFVEQPVFEPQPEEVQAEPQQEQEEPLQVEEQQEASENIPHYTEFGTRIRPRHHF